MVQPLTEDEVLAAADNLVKAFAATDTEAYFSCFDPEASFIFYTEPHRLSSRVEYEALWAEWLDDGWRLDSCESSNRLVQLMGESAVFSHDVCTVSNTANVSEETHERETIIFTRVNTSQITAIHEHLSPAQHPRG